MTRTENLMTIRQTSFALAALAGLALLGACGSGDAPAVPAEAESAVVPLSNGMTAAEVIDARQTHLKAVGKGFKTISDNIKASEPDMAAIQAAAASVSVETADMADWFPEGSGPASGVKTDALPVIWETRADFDAKIADFQAAAATLDTVARAGNITAITEAFQATGATCKACHQTYRADD
jgi:cytochrome c556